MEGKRREKVVDWLQEVQEDSFSTSDITEDAIRAASPLCQALSLALAGDRTGSSARQQQQYNLACHQLSRGLDAHLTSPEQAGAVVRHLLSLAGRMDPGGRHAELARLLLACQPPCALLDEAGADRYWRLCLSLASRQPDLCQLAIGSAVGWFFPGGPADDLAADRRQFRLAHRLLESLAEAFPSVAPDAICELAEARCQWGRPTRQLACYLLNLLQAAGTYLAGRRIRLLFTACRTVAKLESLVDDAAETDGCACQSPPDLVAPVAACRDSCSEVWELPAELYGFLTACASLCRACDRREKLNACLYLLLCHTRDELAHGDWRRTRALYKDLLTVFDREIAHRAGQSRLHLVLALVCSANDSIAHGYLDYLWKRAADSRAGTGLRLRCLALLGDLCARCRFVHPHLLQTVLLVLADYARRLAARYDKQSGILGAEEASMFHACVRALVRIAVSRHRELMGGSCGVLASTHFHLVLRSSLQPWPALPADLRARFALLCGRYHLPEFEAAVADLADPAGAGGNPRRRKKRRRTTLDADALAASSATGAAADDAPPPLPVRLQELSLSEHLLRPLLLEEEPLPPAPMPKVAAPQPQQLRKSPLPPAAHPPGDAEAETDFSLADALTPFARRRKRLRSDCVVFGESN